MEPLEELRLIRDCQIVVTGVRSWRIEVIGVERPARPPRPAKASLTLRALARARVAAPRYPALVAMCLPRFDPEGWPNRSSLNAKEIAAQLRLAGIRATTVKAVNNKLIRIREQIGQELGITIATREELAEIAITHGLVTVDDVRSFNDTKKQAQQDRSRRGLT